MNLKFINAKQAHEVYKYKNTKPKLHRTIAAIWYNKSCRDRNKKPNYVNIRIKGNNKQCKNTMKTAIITRINREIKFLHIKKQKRNEQLYKLHLKWESYWDKAWHHTRKHIEFKLLQHRFTLSKFLLSTN